MMRNRVLIAGIIFCMLFIGIITILALNMNDFSNLSQQHPIIPSKTLALHDENKTLIFLNNTSSPDYPKMSEKNTLISGTGVIVYNTFEGGFFGVLSSDGRQFIPRTLPVEMQVNGTKVAYTFRPVTETFSLTMWGEPVETISIAVIKGEGLEIVDVPLVEYERSGGISGSYELLRLFPSGKGEISKWNAIQSINLTGDELHNISEICNLSVLSSLKSEYMPPSLSPDAVTYMITMGNRSVKTTDTEMPEELRQWFQILHDIMDKYSISPITANFSIEGTTWKLASYVRPDGIPVILPNNTQVSAIFGKNKTFIGSTGCNSFTGRYNQSGGNFSVTPLGIPQMICDDKHEIEIETAYLQLLQKSRFITGKQRSLFLSDVNNTTVLTFTKEPGPDVFPN